MSSIKTLPSISVIIPAHNEQANLQRLLTSLARQTYPRRKIEYIVIDDASTDQTAELAKRFGATVIKVATRDIEQNKGIGLQHAQNDLVYWFDADMEVVSQDFFQKLVAPLVEQPKIAGSYASFGVTDKQLVKNSLVRFLSFDVIHRDPLYQFLVPSVESTIIERKKNYCICKYYSGKMPSSGMMMYRRRELLKTEVGKDASTFLDLESLEIMVRAGYQYYAFVLQARVIHYHVTSLSELLAKRLRNLNRDYLPNIEKKYFTWFDVKDPRQIARLVGWVIYVNLFFPELIRGIFNMMKRKDFAALWQPLVSLTTTDVVLWGMLLRPSGRKFLLTLMRRLLRF